MNPDARQAMLRIAESYEQMADLAETRLISESGGR
jgi:hypothetical protein